MNKQELVTQGEAGTVYILHLDSPLAGQASHYVGWSKELQNRLWHHRNGSGARFTDAANKAGIQYSIAADWPGTRNLERAMKNAKNHKLFCPICMGEKAKNPLEVRWRTHTKRNKALQGVEEYGVSNHTTDNENVEQEPLQFVSLELDPELAEEIERTLQAQRDMANMFVIPPSYFTKPDIEAWMGSYE